MGVGGRVRHGRHGKGLTQYELGQAAGISQATVSHIETGRRVPRITTIRLIASALGVTPGWLLGHADE